MDTAAAAGTEVAEDTVAGDMAAVGITAADITAADITTAVTIITTGITIPTSTEATRRLLRQRVRIRVFVSLLLLQQRIHLSSVLRTAGFAVGRLRSARSGALSRHRRAAVR